MKAEANPIIAAITRIVTKTVKTLVLAMKKANILIVTQIVM